MRIQTKTLLSVLLAISLLSPQAKSHEETSDSFNLEAIARVYELAAQLSPEILHERFDEKSNIPVIKVRGKYLEMNTHMLELVRRWVRIQQAEILRDCQGCITLSEDQLLGMAEDLAREGFFNNKILTPLAHATEHIVEETADIGASFGTTALVAKAASEVAETVLSKSVGGGGIHILCNIIDAVIIFGTRHMQVGWRSFAWAGKDDAGHWWSMPLRYWLVKHGIKRAQEKVGFVAGPIEIDEEALAQIDREAGGGVKRTWFGELKEGSRARFIRYIEKKLEPIHAEIKLIDEQLKDNPENRSLINRRKALEKKSINLTRVTRKNMRTDIMASRKWFFLRSRQGTGRYMAGDSPMEAALGKEFLYIVNVRENILHRGLIPQGDEAVVKSYLANPNLKKRYDDEVLKGLVQERVAKELERNPNLDVVAKTELLEGILSDVAFVFDSSQPASQRYLQTMVIESTLVNFFYKLVKWQVEHMPSGRKNWWAKVWTTSHFRWETGQFVKYSYEYADYLRLAAASGNDAFRERNKYEAMEVLLRVFDHLEAMNEIFQSGSPMTEMMKPISESNRMLALFKPWKDNPGKYSFIPFLKPLPRCEQMWEASHD